MAIKHIQARLNQIFGGAPEGVEALAKFSSICNLSTPEFHRHLSIKHLTSASKALRAFGTSLRTVSCYAAACPLSGR